MTGTGVPVGRVIQGILGAVAEVETRTVDLGMRLGRLEITIPFVAEDAPRYRLELRGLESPEETWAYRTRGGFTPNELASSGDDDLGLLELTIDLLERVLPETVHDG